ncbi:hypothetical protein PYV02_14820 [Leifsonia sp. H3M29-4]|jgi:hypothetical protein|uniref:hypothetical protein n=1 Tax=Salinibacterium metalliresistens TaxID=3031321 RepID=UPI0023DCE804|nr:hypothetical protein [Salinibacterium metalliresistens]MDF1480356.1 hypothetical protein [Salinibacterium metalliresistens]
MTIDRPNLSDAFKGAGSERATGLSGLLQPSTRPQGDAPAPEVTKIAPKTTERRRAEPAAPQRVSPSVDAPTSQRTVVRAQATTSAAGVNVRNTGVYIEGDLLELIRAEKLRQSTAGAAPNYDDLLVTALDQVGRERLRDAFAVDNDQPKGELMPARRRRPRGTAGIQVQLRLDDAQRASLDALAQDVGAPSRSALVATAYRLWLTR